MTDGTPRYRPRSWRVVLAFAAAPLAAIWVAAIETDTLMETGLVINALPLDAGA